MLPKMAVPWAVATEEESSETTRRSVAQLSAATAVRERAPEFLLLELAKRACSARYTPACTDSNTGPVRSACSGNLEVSLWTSATSPRTAGSQEAARLKRLYQDRGKAGRRASEQSAPMSRRAHSTSAP